MLESARIFAAVAAVALLVAVVTWVKVFRTPALQRLDGSIAGGEGQAKSGSRLLGIALGASAVAAVLAMLDLMGR